MTLESERILGADAAAVLRNPVVKMAFQRLGEYLDTQILACKPDDKDQAQRVVLAKQIMIGLKREFERLVEEGEVAEIRLNELEQKNRFRRIIR